ncbi:hypothetical protein TNCV_1431141 [Trichonephila clavipes]|nr:hypothetical protein TNCV_1431141 [Trichonephila clavipes]
MESSSPVTDRIPSRHLPSQRLVESLLAHWPGNPRPLVEQVTPIDPRSHGDPDYVAIQITETRHRKGERNVCCDLTSGWGVRAQYH